MALNVIETVQLPSDVKRLYVDPYADVHQDPLIRNQAFFAPMNQSQDSMLFEKVTQNFSAETNTVIFVDRKPSVQAHHVFVKIWELMQSDERTNSICHRAYWLGEAWNTDEIDSELVSDTLVRDLAERVKRFKTNIGINELIPYVSEVAATKPHVYKVGTPYQQWFKQVKRKSRFDWDVVNAFAKGEKVEPIHNITAFGYTTPVLTADEIEQIYAELKANPEPFREPREVETNKDQFAQLANAVSQLVEIQTKQLTTKKGKNDE